MLQQLHGNMALYCVPLRSSLWDFVPLQQASWTIRNTKSITANVHSKAKAFKDRARETNEKDAERRESKLMQEVKGLGILDKRPELVHIKPVVHKSGGSAGGLPSHIQVRRMYRRLVLGTNSNRSRSMFQRRLEIPAYR